LMFCWPAGRWVNSISNLYGGYKTTFLRCSSTVFTSHSTMPSAASEFGWSVFC
jgi:hypothetical protein